jgi:hypothetical protein
MPGLTEPQDVAIRWVVRAVRAKELREDFTILWLRNAADLPERAQIRQFSGDTATVPRINSSIFGYLVHIGFLFAIPRGDSSFTYSVLQAAYDYVDGGGLALLTPLAITDLHAALKDRLDLDDLKQLCFVMLVDFESLDGKGVSGKLRELLLRVERTQRLAELRHTLVDIRPDLAADLAP